MKLWAICRATFFQAIRQNIFGVLILGTFFILVMSVPFSGWTMGADYNNSDQKMLEEVGLSTLMVAGLLFAAFGASGVLGSEIEDKTALMVVSKPVSRWIFVLGKFFGLAGAVTGAFAICAMVFILTVRQGVMPSVNDPLDMPVVILGIIALGGTILIGVLGNFFFRWVFISTSFFAALALFSIAVIAVSFIGKGWQVVPFGMDMVEGSQTSAVGSQLVIGIILIYMAVLVMTALSVAAGLRFGRVVTLGLCLGLFVIGSIHPYLFERQDGLLGPGGKYVGYIFPRLPYFYQLSALANDREIPMSYLYLSGLYCASYIAALLAVGIAMFQTRSLDSQGSSSAMPPAISVITRISQLGGIILAGWVCINSISNITNGKNYLIEGITIVAGLTCGAAIYFLWRAIAQKSKLSYYTAIIAYTTSFGVIITLWITGSDILSPQAYIWLGAMCIVVATVLVFPKTRHHILKS